MTTLNDNSMKISFKKEGVLVNGFSDGGFHHQDGRTNTTITQLILNKVNIVIITNKVMKGRADDAAMIMTSCDK